MGAWRLLQRQQVVTSIAREIEDEDQSRRVDRSRRVPTRLPSAVLTDTWPAFYKLSMILTLRSEDDAQTRTQIRAPARRRAMRKQVFAEEEQHGDALDG